MKKVIFSAALLMAAATFSFAGNPKETKEAKAETPTETKSEVTLNTYYITGETGSNYDLSTAPNPDCGTAQDEPCKITTNLTLGASVSKSAVDNQVNITIVDRQPAF
ncbi:DUF6520 family protein [Pedobacter sp. B4-66]|uniref:DUF6520 family protein n=1 Tax=Pedobacter sp. B4-66 TaxID=2817280 RepID=UPI001BDA176B|nr:DUF6520 family protein [Pedobacter sp. B4-66]